MTYHRIYRFLIDAEPALPESLAQWLGGRVVGPHLRHCVVCTRYRQRMRALGPSIAAALRGGSIDRALRQAAHALPAPRRAARGGALTVCGAGALSAVLTVALLNRPGSPVPAPLQHAPAASRGSGGSAQAQHGPREAGDAGQLAYGGVAGVPGHGDHPRPPVLAGSGAKESPREALLARTSGQPLPDELYLNGEAAGIRLWHPIQHSDADPVRAWLNRPLPPMRDDFVRTPLTLLAGMGDAGVNKAVEDYQRQAAVVDTRLFRKVTLALKGAALEELCQSLEQQTGVKCRAARGVVDEKVTVFVDQLPARDVMREVARLFGFYWGRLGEPGAYQYDLLVSLRTQLAEEELRNQDLNRALLAVDAQMEAQKPLLDLSLDQLRARAATAQGPEKERLDRLVKEGGWGGMQAYHRLTPAERAALLGGQELTLLPAGGAAGLPPEWVRPILDSCTQGITVTDIGVSFGARSDVGRLVDVPGARPSITLKLNRSELGQLDLESSLSVHIPIRDGEAGVGTSTHLAVGRSPSSENPDNAAANRSLRDQTPFTRVVTLKPEPSCAEPADRGSGGPAGGPHVTSADVWEAVHRETKLPIVADYYSHLYAPVSVTAAREPLFVALCRASDALGTRWRKDGEFVLCRSTSYFWEKLKEVPGRLLRHWQADRAQQGSLPLADFLEMSMLSDAQLDSRNVGPAVSHCWGLGEWEILFPPMRAHARFLASLDPDQRKQAAEASGLTFGSLTPPQQRDFLSLIGRRPEDLVESREAERVREARLRFGYVPAGWFCWPHSGLPAAGPTAAEALAAAQRVEPSVTRDAIERSRGDLLVTVTYPDGEEVGWGKGRGWGRRATVPPPH